MSAIILISLSAPSSSFSSSRLLYRFHGKILPGLPFFLSAFDPTKSHPPTQNQVTSLWVSWTSISLPGLSVQISAPHSVAIPGRCQVKLGMPAECSAYCQPGCPKPAQCFSASSVSVYINKVQNPKCFRKPFFFLSVFSAALVTLIEQFP